MKWFAFFWVYRREFWTGWKRGRRANLVTPLNVTVGARPTSLAEVAGRPLFTRNEVRAHYNLLPAPGWIERPLDIPAWPPKARKRFRRDWFRRR